ncbi:putative TPR-repeat-containing chaperone protein DNAJ,putative [Trypanosoma theileri]|uniref:Putative TPR-repeat-containing chaperone protein DNAJ,putative n=1 Tax=Trypanosoma theileri TaxID=67003 RepID=A0A1X0PA46_9TRYP|nr:putative TPR-repeat-containing chaperone protein DNAJ,putative [Trypanosoma theileri]ORC93796.1 putative TPR-repeat-containing chaperone protein DNAJ,putative [Trypanosoma theileri]
MHQHVHRNEFTQTMPTDRPFSLPRIGRSDTRLRRGEMNKYSSGPHLQGGRDIAGKTFLSRHGPKTWEYTYRPKVKREVNKQVSSCGLTTAPIDRTLPLRRTCDEETACRRLIMANETIERQRLLRQVENMQPVMGSFSTENEERGLRLLSLKNYAGAFVCFTRSFRQNTRSRMAYCKRAFCSWHLLLYDECIEDCRRALDLDRELVSLLSRSFLMRERYQEARQCYDYALQNFITSTEDPYCVKWQTEYEAISALEKFRTFIKEKKWEESLVVKDTAKPLIDGTPLIVLEARALLHVSPPTARMRLIPYIATITRPSHTQTGMSLEEKTVYRSLDEHYLQACVLLAQINVYCGTQYLAVSAALLQTCLAISPGFGPAVLLGHYLVSLEEVLTQVTTLFQHKRYAEAIPIIHDGLELDKSNSLMCSILLCMRAEANAHLGRDFEVINDCTTAISLDPKCSKAYVLRADAHQKRNERSEAAVDRLTAVKLDPTLRHILRGDEEQFLPIPEQTNTSHNMYGTRNNRPRWYDFFKPKSEFESLPKFSMGSDGKSTKQAPMVTGVTTLYDILELEKGASMEDVRAQFKKLTLIYHPDRVVRDTVQAQEEALERFKLINHAHEVLTDPSEKFVYDLSLGIHSGTNL